MKEADDFIRRVNLGIPYETTILKLVEKIIDLTGSRSQLVFNGLPEDDPMRRRPDISLAKEKLNWYPRVPLEDGLTRTIAYFEELLGEKVTNIPVMQAASL